MICFLYKNSIRKYEAGHGTLVYLCCMIYNFSKCDGFTVLWIISIKYCGIKCIASPLKPWYFGTKITSEKIPNLKKDGLL